MTAELSGWGITTALPGGWEGRITHRATPALTTPQAAAPLPADQGWPDERMHPVVHLANFPLPPNRGDYGSGAVERMTAANALIVLFEFGPESVGTALFKASGLPRTLQPSRFAPEALQRRLPGQLGYQHFFTEAGRAFSLFVVLGGRQHRTALCHSCSGVLSTTTIEAR